MVWSFIQNQVLGMQWLNALIGGILTAVGLDTQTRVGGSVQFFLYDVLKITVLLCLLIFVISYVQSYFPPERSKKIMGRFHGIWANCMAALLGTVTPFCSCSSIPLFIGFTSAGLPLGVTFSFLISSPMVDLGSLVLLMSIFGARVAIAYVLLGLLVAVAGGTLIEKMHLEQEVEAFIRNASAVDIESPSLTQRERLRYTREQMTSTFQNVGKYLPEGISLHFGWRGHRRADSQLDSSKLGGGRPGRKQSLRGDAGYGHRHSHVCGHLRHNPHCGGAAVQGCTAGHGAQLHDGRDHALLAFDDHAAQGGQAETVGAVHRHLRLWNHPGGLSV